MQYSYSLEPKPRPADTVRIDKQGLHDSQDGHLPNDNKRHHSGYTNRVNLDEAKRMQTEVDDDSDSESDED